MKKKKGPRAELVIVQTLNNFLQQTKLRTIYIAEGNLPPPELSFFVNFPRLDILLSGSLELQIETNGVSRKIILKRGDAVFIPPNSWNKPLLGHASQVLSILFGKKQTGFSMVSYTGKRSSNLKAIKTSLKLLPHHPALNVLSTLLVICEHSEFSSSAKPLIRALLQILSQSFMQSQEQKHSKAKTTFDSICTYIQENFSSPINRNSVADYFRLNPNHLSRLFRQKGLMNFCDYLNYVRLDRAKFLLKKYELTLDEIAASCGYHDTAYFCRIFKKITKKTPTEFRSKNK